MDFLKRKKRDEFGDTLQVNLGREQAQESAAKVLGNMQDFIEAEAIPVDTPEPIEIAEVITENERTTI